MYRVETKVRFEEPVVKEFVYYTDALAEIIRFTSQFKLGEDPDEELIVKTTEEVGTFELWTKNGDQDLRIYQVLLSEVTE